MSARGRRARRAAAALGLACALVLGGCAEPPARRGRVLLIGTDGASMRVIGPLLEAGRLPTLAALAREGASGPLRSTMPLFSPAIWASIATGRNRKEHGILSFTREGRLFLSTDRKVHALWNIASDAGMTVGVVNWWNTYPVEVIRGIMVSDHALVSQVRERERFFEASAEAGKDVVFPRSWAPTLAALLEQKDAVVPFEDPFGSRVLVLPRWVNPNQLSRVYGTDGTVTRIALAVEHDLHPDLLMVYLPGLDRVSHVLWGTLEPPDIYPPPLRPDEVERAGGAAALRRYYEYTDALLGVLAARYGPDDLVMVVSDHGFEGGREMLTVTGVHDTEKAQDGVVFARGPGIAPGASAAGMVVDDVTPTILAWCGLAVARDMDGAPARFLSVPAVSRVATYDTGTIEHLGDGQASGAEDEILRQLRALGYLQ